MSMTSDLEKYPAVCLMLTMKWSDTYNYSDKNISEFLTGAMFTILDKEEDCLQKVKDSNAAGEEIEFILSLLETNCRHNTYKSYREQR